MAAPLNNLQQFREVQQAIVNLAIKDLRAFAKKVDWSKTADDSVRLSALFQVAVPKIIQKYAAMAAAMACDFYDETRAAAGIKKPFKAEAQPAPPAEGIEAQVRFAARWLFGATPQPSKMLEFLEGEIDKKVKAAYRNTITESAKLDPAQPAFRRIPAGTCDWCATLAQRDADFIERHGRAIDEYEYHPGCNCVPVAVFTAQDGRRDTGVIGNRHANGVQAPEPWQQWMTKLGLDTRPHTLTIENIQVILDGIIDAKGKAHGGHLWSASTPNKSHFPGWWAPDRCIAAIQAVMTSPQSVAPMGDAIVRLGVVDDVVIRVQTHVVDGVVELSHAYPLSGTGVFKTDLLGKPVIPQPLNLSVF